jgi:hypothetical protein
MAPSLTNGSLISRLRPPHRARSKVSTVPATSPAFIARDVSLDVADAAPLRHHRVEIEPALAVEIEIRRRSSPRR